MEGLGFGRDPATCQVVALVEAYTDAASPLLPPARFEFDSGLERRPGRIRRRATAVAAPGRGLESGFRYAPYTSGMKTSLFRRDDCSLDNLHRSDARANVLPAAPKADTYTREALADVVAFTWPELRTKTTSPLWIQRCKRVSAVRWGVAT